MEEPKSSQSLLQIPASGRLKFQERINNPHHQQQYRVISSHVRSLTRKDHTRHLDQITANLTQDQHPFWRWLKNIRGQQAQILNIYRGCDGTVLTTPTEKASFFNQRFSLIFTPENTSNLNELRRELDASWGHDAVSEITICQDEVQDLLSNLDTSKGCGPDDIPARLLKEEAPWLASP